MTASSKILVFAASFAFSVVYSIMLIRSSNARFILNNRRMRSSREGVCPSWRKLIPSSTIVSDLSRWKFSNNYDTVTSLGYPPIVSDISCSIYTSSFPTCNEYLGLLRVIDRVKTVLDSGDRRVRLSDALLAAVTRRWASRRVPVSTFTGHSGNRFHRS